MNHLNLAACTGALACLLLSGGISEAAVNRPAVVSVDMHVLMSKSAPAQKGLEHLQKVQRILEDGYEKLRQVHQKTPREEQDKVLTEGLSALQRQMSLEKIAVSKIVNDIIVDEVGKWRKANRVTLVIDRASVVEGDMEHADFTNTILDLVNKRQAVFQDLPEISVNQPAPPELAQPGPSPAKP